MSNTINGCGSGNCACKSAASVQRRDPFDETDYGTPLRHADVDGRWKSTAKASRFRPARP